MNLPDRVNLALRQRELDNDDAEEYFMMNREAMIEEEIYRLEKEFGIDDLRNALKECSDAHMLSLRLKLETRDSTELLYVIEDIRDAWIKQKATKTVEEA